MEELVFQKRRKKLRGAVVLWSFVLLLLGGALIGASYFVLYDDFFKVKQFEVGGLRSLDEERFLSSLSREMFSASLPRAILGPDNILFWKFGGFPENLPDSPLVSVVNVSANFSAKKVAVETEEKEIFGILCRLEDCWGFDRDGVIFAKVPRVEGYLILKIDDENARAAVLGAPIMADKNSRDNLFNTLEVFKRNSIAISAITIKNISLKEWTVDAASGLKFLFSLEFVPENLEGILNNLDQKFDFGKLLYFDFRVPNRIYYK